MVEAAKAEGLGKSLPALLMHALARTVPQAGELARLLEAWPGDLTADAVTFRLSAGLHALARSGRAPGLAFLYTDQGKAALPDATTLDRALLSALETHTAALGQWLARPVQTNEVARAAGLVAVLMTLAERQPIPCPHALPPCLAPCLVKCWNWVPAPGSTSTSRAMPAASARARR